MPLVFLSPDRLDKLSDGRRKSLLRSRRRAKGRRICQRLLRAGVSGGELQLLLNVADGQISFADIGLAIARHRSTVMRWYRAKLAWLCELLTR
jgi:hypothetical protein